jgi:hypothetical protein
MSKENKIESFEKEANEELKTNCCKLKPNYLDAIPLLKEAADLFNDSKQYEKEKNADINFAHVLKTQKVFGKKDMNMKK